MASGDRGDRYFAPTVLAGVSPDAAVMAEEIFGPILPVIAVDNVDEAVSFVNARPHPLALYVFTDDTPTAERIIERTRSGGVAINHTMVHLGVPDLPFGGVGASGIGAYHGEAGFDTVLAPSGGAVEGHQAGPERHLPAVQALEGSDHPPGAVNRCRRSASIERMFQGSLFGDAQVGVDSSFARRSSAGSSTSAAGSTSRPTGCPAPTTRSPPSSTPWTGSSAPSRCTTGGSPSRG